MYCCYCGKVMPDDANSCAYCGKQVGHATRRRLTRPCSGRKVAGVAAALANYFDVDVTLVRVLLLLAVVFTIPLAIVAYLVAWIVIPEESRRAAMAPLGESAMRPQG